MGTKSSIGEAKCDGSPVASASAAAKVPLGSSMMMVPPVVSTTFVSMCRSTASPGRAKYSKAPLWESALSVTEPSKVIVLWPGGGIGISKRARLIRR